MIVFNSRKSVSPLQSDFGEGKKDHFRFYCSRGYFSRRRKSIANTWTISLARHSTMLSRRLDALKLCSWRLPKYRLLLLVADVQRATTYYTKDRPCFIEPASMGQMGRPAAFDITLSLMSSSFRQGRYKADSSSSEISDNRRVSINTFELPLPKCSNIGTISITSLVVSHFTSIFFLGRNEFLYDNASIYLDANSRGIRS